MSRATAVARPTLDLARVKVKVRSSRALLGAPFELDFREMPYGYDRFKAKAKFTPEPDLDDFSDDYPKPETIARASAYVVDLTRVKRENIAMHFDRIGGEAFTVAELSLYGHSIFDEIQGDDPLSGISEWEINQLVIVDNVHVEEGYRGQRLGPRLLTPLLETIGGAGHYTLVLLQAQPHHYWELNDVELRRARKKIATSYESVGFKHFRKNIYWRHLTRIGAENLEHDAD